MDNSVFVLCKQNNAIIERLHIRTWDINNNKHYRLSSIISIKSCKPFSFSVCLHISSESCSFVKSIKSTLFFSFCLFCFYKAKKSVDFFIPKTHFLKQCLPLPCRDMIWFEIHELGFTHQFKHNLSYHQSRHTFGTLLVSAGVPMESIAKMMGHTNIRTTQGYAKVTDDKTSEDMDRLMAQRTVIQ